MSGEMISADLAARINEAHALATQQASDAMQNARRAGELLLEAKAAVPHGQWLEWLEANVTVGARMAQQYMRLARELPKLDDEKAKRVSHLPIRYAVRQLATAAPKLAVMDDRGIDRVVNVSETGEPLARATYEVNREIVREERRREGEERIAQAQRSGELQVFDLWTNAEELLLNRALRVETWGQEAPHWIEKTRWLISPIPDDEYIAQAVRDEAKALREAALVELERRVEELVEWAHERNEAIAGPFWGAMSEVSDEPILVGRVSVRGDATATIGDISNMGVGRYRTPHKPDECECGNAAPIGCRSTAMAERDE